MKTVQPTIHRARYESFGGIVSSIDPPFLAWVDREFMRGLGYTASPLWKSGKDAPSYLTAPTEVHLAVTNRCSNGCAGCYMDSQSNEQDELSTEALKRALLRLRKLGVFHVALGGGEAFERRDFFEIVSYCRKIGLVPNLTTNGQCIGDREIDICKLMGQVNVSLDGIGPKYGINGRNGCFEKAVNGLRRLKNAGVQTGINCVVSRDNFYLLAEVVECAAEEGLNEVEFLKYKPSGRGNRCYGAKALTQEMIRDFYPMLMEIGRNCKVELKIDCSFIPTMLWHSPPKSDLEKLAVCGCDGGNILLSVRSSGAFSGCSFVENDCVESVFEIENRWHSSIHLKRFRDLVTTAKEPCRSCEYLDLCRCGCRATALYYTGDFFAPDPECPFVYDYTSRSFP